MPYEDQNSRFGWTFYNCVRTRTHCHMIDFLVSKFSDSYAAAQPFVKLNIFFVNLLVFTW